MSFSEKGRGAGSFVGVYCYRVCPPCDALFQPEYRRFSEGLADVCALILLLALTIVLHAFRRVLRSRSRGLLVTLRLADCGRRDQFEHVPGDTIYNVSSVVPHERSW